MPLGTEEPVTIRELKSYADEVAEKTRQIAYDLARDTAIWRVSVETRLSKLEVKMNIIAFLAGTGAVAGIADLIRLMLH